MTGRGARLICARSLSLSVDMPVLLSDFQSFSPTQTSPSARPSQLALRGAARHSHGVISAPQPKTTSTLPLSTSSHDCFSRRLEPSISSLSASLTARGCCLTPDGRLTRMHATADGCIFGDCLATVQMVNSAPNFFASRHLRCYTPTRANLSKPHVNPSKQKLKETSYPLCSATMTGAEVCVQRAD